MIDPEPTTLLELYRGSVQPEWIDFNGHMTESRYLFVFGEATDALLRLIGVDTAYVARGLSYFTVETHLFHRKEAKLGEGLRSETQILACDPKRLHVFHTLFSDESGNRLATGEHMLLHVDMVRARACPADPAFAAKLSALAASHSHLEIPREAGRVGRNVHESYASEAS